MMCMTLCNDDLIGTKTAAGILGLEKTYLTRLVKSGDVPIVTQLDGSNGALVFDRAEVERIAELRAKKPEVAK